MIAQGQGWPCRKLFATCLAEAKGVRVGSSYRSMCATPRPDAISSRHPCQRRRLYVESMPREGEVALIIKTAAPLFHLVRP